MSQRPDAHADSTENSTDITYADGLDDVVHPRLSRRNRLLRAGMLLALVLVVAAGLVWRVTEAGVRTSSAELKTPTLSPVLATALITSNVNFGVVTVNGKKRHGPLPVVVHLRQGQNTIELDAAPFAPTACNVDWPSGDSSGLTCMIANLGVSQGPIHIRVNGKDWEVGGEIMIGADSATLPPAMCTQALAAVARSLSTVSLTTQVPTGQHYAMGGLSKQGIPLGQQASPGLQARLTAGVTGVANGPCAPFLENYPLPDQQYPPQVGNTWNVEISVLLGYSFIGVDGRRVGQSFPSEGNIWVSLVLPSSNNPNWQVIAVDSPLSAQIAGAVCQTGSQMTIDVYQHAYPNNSGMGIGSRGDHGIEGCRIELDTLLTIGSTTANYLWRFGVLMATDATSHKLLPMLPMASAAELAAVPSDS